MFGRKAKSLYKQAREMSSTGTIRALKEVVPQIDLTIRRASRKGKTDIVVNYKRMTDIIPTDAILAEIALYYRAQGFKVSINSQISWITIIWR